MQYVLRRTAIVARSNKTVKKHVVFRWRHERRNNLNSVESKQRTTLLMHTVSLEIVA